MSLTFDELRQASAKRGIEWMGKPNDDGSDLSFCLVELGGETGEALNAGKKLLRARKGVVGGVSSKEPLAEELADVVICAERCAESEGIDLGEAVRRKFNKTSDKYGLTTKL